MATIQQPAPGFSSDGLSYSVAQDFPKIMAQIASEFEARTSNPRYNPFGPSPDAPEQLRREGLQPWDELWTDMATRGGRQPVAATPKTYEIGNRLVQFDASGRPMEVYSAPEKPKPDEESALKKSLLEARMKKLSEATADPSLNSMRKKEAEADLGRAWDDFKTLSLPQAAVPAQMPQGPFRDESIIGGEMMPRQPKGAFRFSAGEDWQFDPMQRQVAPAAPVASPTATSGVTKWVRDASGKMVKKQ